MSKHPGRTREEWRGAWGAVVLVPDSGGSYPAEVYLDSLDPQAQAQFDVRARHLAEHGRIANDLAFKKLEQPDGQPTIWEIKLTPGPGYRFYCWQSGRMWCVSHGCKKPSDRKVKHQVLAARQIHDNWNGVDAP